MSKAVNRYALKLAHVKIFPRMSYTSFLHLEILSINKISLATLCTAVHIHSTYSLLYKLVSCLHHTYHITIKFTHLLSVSTFRKQVTRSGWQGPGLPHSGLYSQYLHSTKPI